MPYQQTTGGFHRVEVTVGNLSSGLDRIPLELSLNVGEEIDRFPDIHDGIDGWRARTRRRMASKAALVNGVPGWSADSSSQAES